MVVTYDDLQKVTGFNKPTEVATCLRNNGVKYMLGKHGRPWTTLGAMELAMGATAIHTEIEQAAPKITF